MTYPFEDFVATVPAELQDRLGARLDLTTSSAVPFWGDAPDSWESVIVAGWRLPGVCAIDGKVRRRHDKKSTAGTNGSTVTYIGDDQAEFTVTVRLWTAEQLSAYAKLVGYLRSMVLSSTEASRLSISKAETLIDNRQKSLTLYSKFPIAPVDVVHPVLSLHGIKSAHVLEYGFPKPKGDAAQGVYEASIRFLEYVPGAKGGVSTPKQSVDLVKRFGPGALGNKAKPSATNGATP